MRRLVPLAALLACGPGLPGPLPRVTSSSPSGAVAPDAVTVEITFSAPVDARGIEDGRLFALCRREDLHDVAQAVESEGGLGPGAPVVAARASVSGDALRAVLRPAAPLDPERAWAAVLSSRVRSADGRPVLDAEGKARTIAVLFETGPAPDRTRPRARWVLPPHGPVPLDLAAVRVAFDEPVTGALALEGVASGGRATALGPDELGLEIDGLAGAGQLALDVGAVRDPAGNVAVAPEPLQVSRCRSGGPPPLRGDVRATSGTLAVKMEAPLLGMGRLVAELSARPGDPDCGVAPAPPATATSVGAVQACPGWDPCAAGAAVCAAEVEVKGLCPGRVVRVRLATEDLAGHRSAPGEWTEVAALPPVGAPVITEALALAEPPQAGGEYVEVANVGTGDLDLGGLVLAKRTASGAFVRCTAAALDGGGPVPPGGYALLVGGSYDRRYPLPPGTALYRCGTTALAGGLADDRPIALALEDAAGHALSTAGIVEPVQRCPAGALERIRPAGPDSASSWACPGARTPGACNRSTAPSDCPARPW